MKRGYNSPYGLTPLKLKKLKQRKKEVEEKILNEIKKLAPEKLKNLQFPPDHKI